MGTGRLGDRERGRIGLKIIATIEADFGSDLWGRRSRLRDEMRGDIILRRTMKRVLAAKRVDSIHLLVTPAEEAVAHEVVGDLPVRVETHNAEAVPWRNYLASSRKWSLDSWRGGIGGTCVFDEAMNPWVLDAIARREAADGVVSVNPAAVLLDPAMLDQVIEHYEKVRGEVRLAFTQSAPGLTTPIYMPAFLADMASLGQPFGRVMAYQPEQPQRDLTAQSCFYQTEAVIAHASGRCIADTDAAVARIDAILQACGEEAEIGRVSQWLIDHRHQIAGELPSEIEIELTTADSLPNSTLRPRGAAVGDRGPMDDATFSRIIEELRGRDDVRVVFGGFGDPLLHPKWIEYVAQAREAGIFGIAVRTSGIHLDQRAVEALIAARVDVLNVLLDAVSAGTYAHLHGANYYDQVVKQVEHLLERQREIREPWPLVVCEMLKTRATMGEMEAFYDFWVRKAGAAVISGPSDYAGQWPNHAVMCMAPPNRSACEQIFSQAMVLADGRMTVCDQDFRGEHALGTIQQLPLSELWIGKKMTGVRQSHLQGRYDGIALCAQCQEWHRP